MAWRARCLYCAGAGAGEVVAAARSGGDAAESQRAILAAVADAAAAGVQPAPGAARRLLRAAVLAAEAAGEEVSDALADAYAAELLQPEAPAGGEGPAWCHRAFSYSFADDVGGGASADRCLGAISLRCSADMLAGATGCASWEAGLALAEAALSRTDVFTCCRVLELGSGAGAAAVALARAAPAQLLCTDGSAAALANLRRNLAANGVAVVQREQDALPDLAERAAPPHGSAADGSVTCAVLSWQALTPQAAAALAPDVVVGADLIYDPEAVPALLRCVALLLSRGAHDGAAPTGLPFGAEGAGDEAPHALLVSLLRSPESYAYFEATCAAMGLQPEDVTAEVLGPPDAGEAGAAASDDELPLPPPGMVRFCHLPRAALPRERVRAHRLHPPRRDHGA